MDQESLSEIVFGQLLGSKIVRDTVRPEIFVPPFDKGVEMVLADKPKELITIKIGPSAMQAAQMAAESVLGSKLNYAAMLEISYLQVKLADRLNSLAKKLRQGDEVDLTDIIEQWNVMQGTQFDMVSMYDIQADSEPFIQSGWTAIDRHLVGLPKVGLLTIGGSPGAGKTTLLIHLVKSFLHLYLDKLVAVFTLEMPAAEFKYRAIGLHEFSDDEQKRCKICDQVLTVEEVAQRAAKVGEKLGLVVIDFADLMVHGDMSEPEMAKIYLTCYSLAKRLKIPVVLLSQLNRNYTGGVPRPIHLRYTSLAEAVSWGIWMIYNPYTEFHATDDSLLPPLTDKSYILAWKMRGGIQRHDNKPGAISLGWTGATGWADDCEETDWFILKT